ncbi:BrxA family protein [Bacillus velezensis]|uniref:BrxA family protein n=1 Tax=Bacillus velezensis TaxID=492670 RepID=UPI002DBAA8EA|nr:BrxA family protein [Bacillus velezensis]MEC3849561.1 DUF1819 family protein [Bacillus velezensis]
MTEKYTAELKTVGAEFEASLVLLRKLFELKSLNLLEVDLYENNLMLKRSRHRIKRFYEVIKRRYLSEFNKHDYVQLPLLDALQHLSKEESVSLLYFHLCLSDKILYDFVKEVAYPRYVKGFLGVSNEDSEAFLISSSEIHEEMKDWTDRTYKDLKSAIITVLCEVGFLKNRKNPQFNEELFISHRVFGYLLYFNMDYIQSLNDVYDHDDFKLFFLDKQQRKLMIKELKNSGVIHLEEQKETIIDYKFPSLKEFVVQYVIGKD